MPDCRDARPCVSSLEANVKRRTALRLYKLPLVKQSNQVNPAFFANIDSDFEVPERLDSASLFA